MTPEEKKKADEAEKLRLAKEAEKKLQTLKNEVQKVVDEYMAGKDGASEELSLKAIEKLPENERAVFIGSVESHKKALLEKEEEKKKADELQALKDDAQKVVDLFMAGKGSEKDALDAIENLPAKERTVFIESVNAQKKALQEKADETERLKKEQEKAKDIPSGNFIMKVTYLSWGKDGRGSFYADKKPLINAKVMGKYAGVLKKWLDAGWIEKGSYKK
jgi:hypothetical protein